MFCVYTIQGPTFEGTLEQLYKVRPVVRSHRAKLNLHEEHAFDNIEARREARAAEQAYRQALNLEHERSEIYHVHQIMHPNPHHVSPDLPIRDAWLELQLHKVKQLPVINTENRIVGLLTESNLLQKIIVTGQGDLIEVPQEKVSNVMTSPVITADPMTDIRRIAKVMADYKFSAIPITQNEKGVVGIVTRGDILRKFANTPPLEIWS